MPSGTQDEIDPAIAMRIAALSEEMQRNGGERDDPVRSIMGLLGDRWSALILLVLATGEWRHADLRRTTARLSSEQAISQRVLTLKLRSLEREGLVARHATADVPPKVSYSLTPLGRELHGEVRRQIDWISQRRSVIEKARRAFDEDA
ncbi:MAG: helix-turn-helix domain-containing protein [Pseudomonadota bacterium]